MATKELNELLERLQKGRRSEVDLEGAKRIWLESIRRLYEKVEIWLLPQIEKNLLTIKHTEITVREESLGVYDAPGLELEVGGRVVTVEPIARFIFGGAGRVDMGHGPRSRVLIKTPDEIDRWLISTPDPKDRGRELNQESLADALTFLFS